MTARNNKKGFEKYYGLESDRDNKTPKRKRFFGSVEVEWSFVLSESSDQEVKKESGP